MHLAAMKLTVRIMAVVEAVIGSMFASLLLVDRLDIAGPDSTLTALLGLSCLAVAVAAIICFAFCLPVSIGLLISSPPERTVLHFVVVALAAFSTLGLGTWLMHISGHLSR